MSTFTDEFAVLTKALFVMGEVLKELNESFANEDVTRTMNEWMRRVRGEVVDTREEAATGGIRSEESLFNTQDDLFYADPSVAAQLDTVMKNATRMFEERKAKGKEAEKEQPTEDLIRSMFKLIPTQELERLANQYEPEHRYFEEGGPSGRGDQNLGMENEYEAAVQNVTDIAGEIVAEHGERGGEATREGDEAGIGKR